MPIYKHNQFYLSFDNVLFCCVKFSKQIPFIQINHTRRFHSKQIYFPANINIYIMQIYFFLIRKYLLLFFSTKSLNKIWENAKITRASFVFFQLKYNQFCGCFFSLSSITLKTFIILTRLQFAVEFFDAYLFKGNKF